MLYEVITSPDNPGAWDAESGREVATGWGDVKRAFGAGEGGERWEEDDDGLLRRLLPGGCRSYNFV